MKKAPHERFFVEVHRGEHTLSAIAHDAEAFGRHLTDDLIQLLQCGDGKERPLLDIPSGLARALQSRSGASQVLQLWYRNRPGARILRLSPRHFGRGSRPNPTLGELERRGVITRVSHVSPPQHRV